jgi:hypothetical protein
LELTQQCNTGQEDNLLLIPANMVLKKTHPHGHWGDGRGFDLVALPGLSGVELLRGE